MLANSSADIALALEEDQHRIAVARSAFVRNRHTIKAGSYWNTKEPDLWHVFHEIRLRGLPTYSGDGTLVSITVRKPAGGVSPTRITWEWKGLNNFAWYDPSTHQLQIWRKATMKSRDVILCPLDSLATLQGISTFY